ncbi:MAG: zinc ABC transporter substrate-binding protein [Spirochaetales bacterium]|nr:zinc ABC transporter substrate-binding protein [Spirochaetales bacterium]
MKPSRRLIVMTLTAFVFSAASLAVIPVACGNGGKEKPAASTSIQEVPRTDDDHESRYRPEPLNIVVTTDFIRELVYMFARYRSNPTPIIIKPGTNPLLYKATESDETLMMDADLVIYNGLGLEPGLSDTLERVGKTVPCRAITACLSKEDLIRSDLYESGYDPHVWWDLTLWEKILRYMVDILATVDPEFEFDYGSTFIRYGQELSFVRRYIGSWASRIPGEKRILVTLHDAFRYFGRAFDFEVKSLYLPGTDTMNQKRLNELADFIIAGNIETVFPEKAFPHDDLQRLINEVEKRGGHVTSGDELYAYSLGEMNTPEYIFLRASRIMIARIYKELKPPDGMDMPK